MLFAGIIILSSLRMMVQYMVVDWRLQKKPLLLLNKVQLELSVVLQNMTLLHLLGLVTEMDITLVLYLRIELLFLSLPMLLQKSTILSVPVPGMIAIPISI